MEFFILANRSAIDVESIFHTLAIILIMLIHQPFGAYNMEWRAYQTLMEIGEEGVSSEKYGTVLFSLKQFIYIHEGKGKLELQYAFIPVPHTI